MVVKAHIKRKKSCKVQREQLFNSPNLWKGMKRISIKIIRNTIRGDGGPTLDVFH